MKSPGLLSLLLVYPLWVCAAAPYTMADLQALASGGGWAELTEHLQDIPPAKRDQSWNTLAGSAVSRRFAQLVSAGNDAATYQFLADALPRYQFLSANSAFMKQRADFGLRYFDSCLSYDDESCHRELLSFVAADPDPALALSVARQVRRRLSDSKAIEYYRIGLAQKPGADVCGEEDLRLSLTAAISTPPGGAAARAAKDVASGYCFDSLVETLSATIKSDDNAKRNACGLMNAKQALKGITGKKCAGFTGS